MFTCLGLFCFGGKLDNNNNAMCSAATAVIGRVSVFCDKGANASARPAKLRACAPNDSRFHAVYTVRFILNLHTSRKISRPSTWYLFMLASSLPRADEICL